MINKKMKNLNRDENIVGIIIFLFGAITAILSIKMPIGTFRMPGTGMFPLCLGILLMILSAAFVLRLLFQSKNLAVDKVALSKSLVTVKQLVLFLGTIVLATLFFKKLGYPLASFILLVVLFRILGVKNWIFNISLSLIAAGASYFTFVQWLKIPLPKGWIGL